MSDEDHMTQDDARKLDDLHRYFMRPPLPGQKTRAAELDELLAAARAGKITARIVLWALGFVAAAGAAFGVFSGWGQK